MWQQAARSIHLHPVLLNKADGKRIVLEAAQKDTKVKSKPKMKLTHLKNHRSGVCDPFLLPRFNRFFYPRQRICT
jgi:hypothetical protein